MYLQNNCKMIIFPHAGGLAFSYMKLRKMIEQYSGISASVYEYAGRGEKIRDLPYENFSEAVKEIAEELLEKEPAQKYYLFGHSMGGYIAMEVATELQKQDVEVCGVFISGVASPYYQPVKTEEITDTNILRYLKVLESLPEDIMEKESLKKLYMNIIRQDFLLLNTYHYKKGSAFEKLIILYGESDPVIDEDQLMDWSTLQTDTFDMVPYEGNHFYLFSQEEMIGRDIAAWM